MFPTKDSIQKVKLPFDLRQGRSESFEENNDIKYTRLSDVTSTSSLDSSGTLIMDTIDDQKLPQTETVVLPTRNSFYYVNKNGYASENLLSPKAGFNNIKKVLDCSNPIMSDHFLIQMSKIENENVMTNNDLDSRSVTRSVPSDETVSFNHSLDQTSNQSLVHREHNGDVVINTNLTIQEPNIEITSDHIKYINLFSILCCWCFPITGLMSVFYSRMTKKYYNMRDLVNAKKYLKRSEWTLIATFFFGKISNCKLSTYLI